MTIPSSALPQPITVKHVFKLCDHHQLAQLHNAIYSRIPYDKEMTIADAIDHNREYQHALALMQGKRLGMFVTITAFLPFAHADFSALTKRPFDLDEILYVIIPIKSAFSKSSRTH